MNQQQVTPSSDFQVGDYVAIELDADPVGEILRERGLWNDDILLHIKSIGRVKSVTNNGDLVVHFADQQTFTLDPAVCRSRNDALLRALAQEESQDSASSQRANQNSDPMESEELARDATDQDNVSSSSIESTNEPSPSDFRVGDFIAIEMDADLVQDTLSGFGQWNEDILMIFLLLVLHIKSIGRVQSVTNNGDLVVNFADEQTFTLNPAVCCSKNDALFRGLTRDEAQEAATPQQTDNENDDPRVCTICCNQEKSVVFDCGHTACGDCSSRMSRCSVCRRSINDRRPFFL